ncbi:hypothetical protein [Streptomyces sp. NPDC098926]|uniref:hypothetical protein n=1 Tax=Streptomyces sp. NPDC098926 TaxID=3366099 RepID=UPI0037F71A37
MSCDRDGTCFTACGVESTGHVDIVSEMPERWTPAHRLMAENGIVELLLVVRTKSGLPARLPTTRPAVTA